MWCVLGCLPPPASWAFLQVPAELAVLYVYIIFCLGWEANPVMAAWSLRAPVPLGGWEASFPHIFLWLGGFVFCLLLEVWRNHWKPVWATTGGTSLCLVISGRLVIWYLYGQLIYYGVYAVRMFIHAHTSHYWGKRWGDQWKHLQVTTGGPISPVIRSSDWIFVSPADARTPHPIWDSGHLSPPLWNWFSEMALPLAASPISENFQNVFLFCLTISLTLEATLSCEGAVALAMLKNAAYNSHRHNSSSCDGLQLEFYIAFFPLLHNDFLLMANSLPHLDTLTATQRNTSLPAYPKTGTWPHWPTGAPLASLMLIISKINAERVAKILPQLINHDETCNIPSRKIKYNISLIRDVIDFGKTTTQPLWLLTMDQMKALIRSAGPFFGKSSSDLPSGPNSPNGSTLHNPFLTATSQPDGLPQPHCTPHGYFRSLTECFWILGDVCYQFHTGFHKPAEMIELTSYQGVTRFVQSLIDSLTPETNGIRPRCQGDLLPGVAGWARSTGGKHSFLCIAII